MRALRVVGITEIDGETSVVLEDPDRRERFSVPADEQLRAAARGDLSRLGQIAIEVESQLRPREIQARIRAGASVEQVANAAGVPLQKIDRFAYPVLLERSRTAEVAQRAHPVRSDGPDPRMLGDVVAHTFSVRGQEYVDVDWDSWKGEDGRWVVSLSWHAGHSDIRAHWTFQPGANGGTVTALDENASDLVEGLPARPLRPVGPVIDMARPDDLGPGPAPVPELRAAASDSRRGPEAGYLATERATTRTAPESWRTGPPAQRQPSHEQRPAEHRPTEHRPTEHRPNEYRPDEHPSRSAEARNTGHRPADPAPEPARAEPSRPEPSRTESPRTESPRTDGRAERPAEHRPAERVEYADAPRPRTPEPAPPAAERPSDRPAEQPGDTATAASADDPTDRAADRGADRGAARRDTPAATADDVRAGDEPTATVDAGPDRGVDTTTSTTADAAPVAPEVEARTGSSADTTADNAVDSSVEAEVEAPVEADARTAGREPAPAATDTPAEVVTEADADATTTADTTAAADTTADTTADPEHGTGATRKTAGGAAEKDAEKADAAPAAEADQPAEPEAPTRPTRATKDAAGKDVAGKDAAAKDTPAKSDAPAKETPAKPARRTRKGKPVMPSWDEVLLGVRGQH